MLLDGPGEYTSAFARWGLHSAGIDLDQAMIEVATEQKNSSRIEADFVRADMTDLPFNGDYFDACICIGNSFVHLLQEEQHLQALRDMYRVLKPGGVLLLQTVNYDRILRDKVLQLPKIFNEDVGLTFERSYSFRDDGLIDFRTVLRVPAGNNEKCVIENTVPLYPLTLDELLVFMKKVGFFPIKPWSGFSSSPWDIKAFATVVEAYK